MSEDKKTNVVDTVKNSCTKAVENLGFDLYEVTYKKESGGMNLTLYIDKEGGVTLEDCESVNNVIEPIIDKLEPTGDVPYTLNVSSLGLDWPIKTERDFVRNAGKVIEVKLYQKDDGKKEYKGKLLSWTADSVTLLITLKNGACKKTFERQKIANIVPYIEF